MILLPFLSNNNYIILNHINKINKSDRDILLVHFYQTVLPGFFFFGMITVQNLMHVLMLMMPHFYELYCQERCYCVKIINIKFLYTNYLIKPQGGYL